MCTFICSPNNSDTCGPCTALWNNAGTESPFIQSAVNTYLKKKSPRSQLCWLAWNKIHIFHQWADPQVPSIKCISGSHCVFRLEAQRSSYLFFFVNPRHICCWTSGVVRNRCMLKIAMVKNQMTLAQTTICSLLLLPNGSVEMETTVWADVC